MDSRKLITKVFTLLLCLIIVHKSLSLSIHSEDVILDLKILGATSPGVFIPGPCPPGVQCTYDSAGALGIVFRLTYHGESQCNVSDILLWHTVRGFNFTGPINISPPAFLLLTDTSYEFIVKKPFVYGAPIDIRIQTLQQGDFYYKLTVNSSISHITDWNPILPTSGNTGITFSPIIFGILLIVIFVRRWNNK
ncbi:MAG: hypothetical protein ACTSW1_10565 [Candidatus Hodarchaeales archaeon]